MIPYRILTKLDFVCSLFFLSLFIYWTYKGQNILFLDLLAFIPIITVLSIWLDSVRNVTAVLRPTYKVGSLPTPMSHSVAYVEAI